MSKKVIVKRKRKTVIKQVIAGMLALSIAISGTGLSIGRDCRVVKAVSNCYSAFVPRASQTISVNHGLELDDAFDRTAFTKQYTAGTTISVSQSNSKRNAYLWNSRPLSGGSSSDNTYTILVLTDKNDRIVYAESMIHIGFTIGYYIKDAEILYGSMPLDIVDNRLSSLGTSDIASVDYSSYGYKAGSAGANVSYNMCTLSTAADKTSLDYNIYTYQSNVGSSLGSYSISYVEGVLHLSDKFNAHNILSVKNGCYYLEGTPTTTALKNLCNNKTKDGEDLFSVSDYTFYGWTSTYQSEYTLKDEVITGYNSLRPSTNGTHYYPAFISKTPKVAITVNDSTSKTQSVTLSATDDRTTSGGLKYYFGTESNPDSSSYIASSGPGYFSIAEEISSAGTYYFIVKDEEGNSNRTSVSCYDVTMNLNGGSVTYGGTKYTDNFTITRANGETINLPAASKSGYTFQSWSGSIGTYMVKKTTSLTAFYNDAAAPDPSIAIAESNGLMQNLILSATDNEGVTAYYFGTSSSPGAGSYTNVSSTKNWSQNVIVDNAGTYYLYTKDAIGNVSTAKTIICYAITFNPNGGCTTFGGTSYDSNFTAIRANGASMVLPSVTKSGYRFTGWDQKNGTYVVSSGVTLTAGFVDVEQSTASITVNGSSDSKQSLTLSGTDNEGITAYYFGTSSSPGVESYISISSTKNWTKDVTVDKEGTYYLYTRDAAGNVSPVKSVSCYKIDFNPNGGTLNYDGNSYNETFSMVRAQGTLVNLPSAERNGYTFNGWNSQTGVYTINSNDSLTAKWTPVEYSISYNLDGGKLKKENPVSYTIETDDLTLNNPEKDGYSFEGWTGSNGETASKEVTVAKGNTGNLEFTAKWIHLYDYNPDTKSLLLYSGSKETITDVISKHPEAEAITMEADVDAGMIDFSLFTSLKTIALSEQNTSYVSENGILYDTDMKMIYCPPAHEDNPSISKRCTDITEKAFKNSTITTLKIPYSVKRIWSGAFENCTKLSEITIKNPDCTIEEGAISSTVKTVYGFEDSTALNYCAESGISYKVITALDYEFFADEVSMTSFRVPENITDIGAYAFAGTPLQNEENNGMIVLPKSVKNVEEGAFSRCDAIKKIHVNSMTTEFAWNDATLTIPKTVIMECYYGSKAYDYAILHNYPISLLVGYEEDNTEEYVTGDTDNLICISFGPKIKKIGKNAFAGAKNLSEVSFSQNSMLQAIGNDAFSGTGLKLVNLPDSVTTLGTGVFADSALTKLIVKNPNCKFPDAGGLIPEGAVIKGYQNSSADIYSQTYYDKACEGFGKPAYVVYFDMTGGRNGTEKLYMVNGEKTPSIEVPERDDYDFAGYYVQENGKGTKYFDAEGNSVKEWDNTANMTLYALWVENTKVTPHSTNTVKVTTKTEAGMEQKTKSALNTSQTLNQKKSGGKKPTAITTGNVVYKLLGNTATVSRAFSKKIGKVTIPKTVHVNGKSYRVTSITKNAFKGCKKLKKVSIKANIRKVEKSAFAGIHKKAVFKIPKKSYVKVKKLLSRKSVGYKKTMKILKK